MTNVACFCGCFYSFDSAEGPCPKCGAVAGVHTAAIRLANRDREHSQPDAAAAGASHPMLLALALGLGSAQRTS